ncbi:MAG: glycosyltransferase [Bacteroidota bacterium]
MIIILSITGFLIFSYLLYPLWLDFTVTGKAPRKEKETEEINSVSVILLSFNGCRYLKDKINFLLRELSSFDFYELIIVDDNSQDGSAELLNEYRQLDHIKVLNNKLQYGIPFSMNLGIVTSRYDYVVFCDQRQELSEGILKKIVEPLRFARVGAVSGCISYRDKSRKCSLLRRHENFLKHKESKAGSLIGVYGPFYAIKKECYSPIPGYIILDDLYLSLAILKSKEIELREDCHIIDDNFSILYDYRRIRRYLIGFIQILNEKKLMHEISNRQKIMLIWHKYLRLLIPLSAFFIYISAGLKASNEKGFAILFLILTLVGLLSVVKFKEKFWLNPKNLIRINILYFIGLIDVIMDKIFLRKPGVRNYRKKSFENVT